MGHFRPHPWACPRPGDTWRHPKACTGQPCALRARRIRTNTEETKRPRRQRIKTLEFCFCGNWDLEPQETVVVRWRGRSWRGRLRGGAKIPLLAFSWSLLVEPRWLSQALDHPKCRVVPLWGHVVLLGGPEGHQGLTM